MQNFNLQEKTTSTVEVTTNFVKKFKANFEKKLCIKQELLLSNIKIFHGKANDLCMLYNDIHL